MGNKSLENVFSIKKIPSNKLVNGIYELEKSNSPKRIDKDNNNHIIHINEKNESEDLYIHSHFDDDSFAIIGTEFYLTNFLRKPKAVDMSYYHLTADAKVSVFLYDMKKSFVGIHEMEDIIEQWAQSIRTAKACFIQLKDQVINNIQIGVITENNDFERRKRELEPILNPEPVSSNLSSFMQSQRKADTSANLSKAKLLKGFDEGKVTIDGVTYEYDVREFVDKKYDMYFENGNLK